MRPALLLTTVALYAHPAPVEWVSSTPWPLERLAKNLDAYVAEHPNNAHAHYVLGRVHGQAFVLARKTIGLYAFEGESTEGLLGILKRTFDEESSQRYFANAEAVLDERGEPLGDTERLAHLSAAVEHLHRALELAAGRADYQLGFAYLVEQGAPFVGQVDTLAAFGLHRGPPPAADSARLDAWLSGRSPVETEPAFDLAELERNLAALVAARTGADAERARRATNLLGRYWLERAIAAYDRGHALGFERDRGLRELPMAGPGPGSQLEELVSYECGTAYVRLVQQRGPRDERERTHVAEVAAHLETLGAIPHSNAITPIVLSLAECRGLEELVDPHARVAFDLDGDGNDEPWPWLAPDAGWLVWDPERRGEITSGQQLFGSRSGWLFFEDGYRVLDALDDDRDGFLRGAELVGIAVWFDRDSDGVSDRGEVVPVEELGIAALATESTLTLGASPANLCGVEMKDGRVLPTYDWVLRPLEE
jgi:hypothetical protein